MTYLEEYINKNTQSYLKEDLGITQAYASYLKNGKMSFNSITTKHLLNSKDEELLKFVNEKLDKLKLLFENNAPYTLGKKYGMNISSMYNYKKGKNISIGKLQDIFDRIEK
jgi:DNA-binding Xre family transcriptional regulator